MTFLKNFFMCMKLETGAYIIASLEIFKLIFLIIVGSIALSEKEPEEISDRYPYYLLALLVCVVHFISSVFLIIGAHRQKSNYILPWIIMTAIGLIGLIGLIVMLVAGATVFDSIEKIPAAYSLVIVKYVMSFVLTVYFWLCMLSLYKKISETESSADSAGILKSTKINGVECGIPYEKWQTV